MGAFDDISLAYDNTIDWKTRLSQEIPFLLSLLDNPKEKRVLDMACGSGRHSVSLAKHGAQVTGLDMSRTMIQAAQKHAESNGVKPVFIIADMVDVGRVVEGAFDLVICLGNSLALLNSVESVRSVMKAVYKLLNDGGSFVAQVLNFEEVHWTGFRNFPTKTGKLSDGTEVTFSRLFEHTDYPDSSTLIMSVSKNNDGAWISEVSTQKVLNLKHNVMSDALIEAGLGHVEFYSDYQRSPFDRKTSRNMVIRALK